MARTRGSLNKKTIEKIRTKVLRNVDLTEKEQIQVKSVKNFNFELKVKPLFNIEEILKTKISKKILNKFKYKSIPISTSEIGLIRKSYQNHNRAIDKYTYVWDSFFIKEQSDEYLLWEADDDIFIRTTIKRGTGVTKKKLNRWKNKYIKQLHLC